MAISQMLLPEFDQEMATTRKLLERFPSDKADWRPHSKSMTFGRLAGHLAELPHLGLSVMTQEKLNLDGSGYQPFIGQSAAQLLEKFDGLVAETRKAIEKASDDELMKMWTFAVQGQTVFTLPRIAAIRALMMSHIIHHRGQLSVYLRMNEVAVPSIYGPSADEAPAFMAQPAAS